MFCVSRGEQPTRSSDIDNNRWHAGMRIVEYAGWNISAERSGGAPQRVAPHPPLDGECGVCDCYDYDDAPGARVAITLQVIGRMRALESSFPGEPVPAEVWPVFLGEAGGAIAFGHFERLARCRQLVLDEEMRRQKLALRMRRRRPAAPSCA